MLFWITKWKWRDVTFELNEGSNWLIILESEIYVLFFIFQYYFEPHETKLDELYIEFLLCRAYDVSLTFTKIGLLPYLNKSQEGKKVQSFTLQNLDLANIFWAIRDMSLQTRLLKLHTSCTLDSFCGQNYRLGREFAICFLQRYLINLLREMLRGQPIIIVHYWSRLE